MKRLLLALVVLVMSSIAFAAVNINTATLAELEALPGIGPVKGQAIIDYRKANGPFKSIDDLKKVNGIGDATLEKVKQSGVSLSGTTTLPAATFEPSPTSMLPRIVAPAPIITPRRIFGWRSPLSLPVPPSVTSPACTAQSLRAAPAARRCQAR